MCLWLKQSLFLFSLRIYKGLWEGVFAFLLSFALLEVESSLKGMSQIEFNQELSIYIDSKKKKRYFPPGFWRRVTLMFKH